MNGTLQAVSNVAAAGRNVTLPPTATLPPAAVGGNVTLRPAWLFFSVYRTIMGNYLNVLKKSLVW